MKGYPNAKFGYHKSHRRGVDFDVQIIRTDDVEAARSAQVGQAKYDKTRTAELIQLFRELGDVQMVLFADDSISGVRKDKHHTYHFHVRLNEP